MAKFMFLFCILLALVHENVAKWKSPRGTTTTQAPSTSFNFDDCVAAKKTHSLFVDFAEAKKIKLAKVTCIMLKLRVLNKHHVMDSNKLNDVSLRAYRREGSDEEIQRTISLMSSKATFENPGDTAENIYAYWAVLMAVMPGLKDNVNINNLP